MAFHFFSLCSAQVSASVIMCYWHSVCSNWKTEILSDCEPGHIGGTRLAVAAVAGRIMCLESD
jgi:hypothetical protein